MRTDAEMGGMRAQAKERRPPPEAGRGKEQSSPAASQKARLCRHFDLSPVKLCPQTCALHWERMRFGCVKPAPPQETNTVGECVY